MDTSDSEASFESADEDFDLDKEKFDKTKQNTKHGSDQKSNVLSKNETIKTDVECDTENIETDVSNFNENVNNNAKNIEENQANNNAKEIPKELTHNEVESTINKEVVTENLVQDDKAGGDTQIDSNICKIEEKIGKELSKIEQNVDKINIKEDSVDKDEWNDGWEVRDEDMWGKDDWEVREETKETQETRVPDWDIKKEETNEIADDLWGEQDGWEIDEGNKVEETNLNAQKQDNPRSNDNLSESLNKLVVNEEKSWSSWGNWGISSVLSTAATITSSVSQGITNVIETSIGVPEPEQLAREHQAERPKLDSQQPETETASLGFGLGNLVSGVSTIQKLVETTSTKVIAGGLDTLETIGKKTMEVLQENDPGLKKKRAFLKMEGDKPVLSQVLREAKEKAEMENQELERKHIRHKKANYETIFDDYQGLVHLEALEMLSKQCDIKLEMSLSKCENQIDVQETLDQVKELCEICDDEEDCLTIDDIKERIDAALADINISITYNKILEKWDDIVQRIDEFDVDKENDLHEHAIENLAHLTAMSVEQFHKAGELLLIKEHHSTADEADSLVQLTVALSSSITLLATKYTEKLSKSSNKDEIKSLITNIFLEASNSSRYVKDAFLLLIPVLQVGAI